MPQQQVVSFAHAIITAIFQRNTHDEAMRNVVVQTDLWIFHHSLITSELFLNSGSGFLFLNESLTRATDDAPPAPIKEKRTKLG